MLDQIRSGIDSHLVNPLRVPGKLKDSPRQLLVVTGLDKNSPMGRLDHLPNHAVND